jgi:AcrR family transcriptional regulator
MSPRPYNLGKRQEQIDESRRRVVEAARALLAEATSYTAFTVDAVAKRADVARATVYYQFGSKTGLIEALCDALAETGQISDLSRAFTDPDPVEALATFVAAFSRFWAADPLVMRRLRALAALDPEVGAVIAKRDAWRRKGLALLVDRLTDQPLVGESFDPDQAVRALHALTSFETFETLAGADRTIPEVTPLVVDLVQAALLAGDAGRSKPPRKRQARR